MNERIRPNAELEFREQHTWLLAGLFLNGKRIAYLPPGSRPTQKHASLILNAWEARGCSEPLSRAESAEFLEDADAQA